MMKCSNDDSIDLQILSTNLPSSTCHPVSKIGKVNQFIILVLSFPKCLSKVHCRGIRCPSDTSCTTISTITNCYIIFLILQVSDQWFIVIRDAIKSHRH